MDQQLFEFVRDRFEAQEADISELRTEMRDGFAAIRRDMADPKKPSRKGIWTAVGTAVGTAAWTAYRMFYPGK